MLKRLLYAAVVPAVAWPTQGHVRAYLRRAMPISGSTIRAAPAELTLDYTDEVEPHFCTVAVLNAQDQRVDKRDLHIAPTTRSIW